MLCKSVRSSGPIGARESARMQATYTRLSAPVRAHIRLTPAFRRGQRALIILCHGLTNTCESLLRYMHCPIIRFNTLLRFPNSYQLLLSSAFSSQGCRHNDRPHTCAQHALERSDYPQWPPAPQEQSFALTRRRHNSPQPVKTLGQFCPRVLPHLLRIP